MLEEEIVIVPGLSACPALLCFYRALVGWAFANYYVTDHAAR